MRLSRRLYRRRNGHIRVPIALSVILKQLAIQTVVARRDTLSPWKLANFLPRGQGRNRRINHAAICYTGILILMERVIRGGPLLFLSYTVALGNVSISNENNFFCFVYTLEESRDC